MENEIILTAKTVEEAMSEAREKYGAEDKELSFTILEMPKKGFMGIGAAPAKVKVTISKIIDDVDLTSIVNDLRSMKIEDDQPKTQPQKQHSQKQNHNNHNKNRDAKPQQNQPNEDSLPAALRKPAARPEAPKKQNPPKKQASRPEDNRPEAEKKKDLLCAVMGINAAAESEKKTSKFETFGKKIEKKVEKIEDKCEDKFDEIEDKFARAMGTFTDAGALNKAEKREEAPRVEFVTPEEMEFALDFANTLMTNMSLPAKAVHNPDSRGVEIPEGMVAARMEIVGDDSGILIGHHGETLDAIQYLVNLCASRKSASAKREFVKIVVDIEGYREKREETLRALARRMAAKAVKNRRNVVLEPMNPYERRIIHSEVQGIENVSTHSVGSDENRKIVITYEGADKIQSGKKRNDRRRGKGSADKAAHTEKTEKIEKTPKDDRPRQKPVRAKSIDEIRLDLSEESTATIGSLTMSAPADEEESLREY